MKLRVQKEVSVLEAEDPTQLHPIGSSSRESWRNVWILDKHHWSHEKTRKMKYKVKMRLKNVEYKCKQSQKLSTTTQTFAKTQIIIYISIKTQYLWKISQWNELQHTLIQMVENSFMTCFIHVCLYVYLCLCVVNVCVCCMSSCLCTCVGV